MKIPWFAILVFCVGSLFAEPRWEPVVDPPSLYPSFIISTATMDKSLYVTRTNTTHVIGAVGGQIGFMVVAPSDDCYFVATVSSPKFIRKSILEGRLAKAGDTYLLYPEIDYDHDALYRVLEPVPETVTFRLVVGDEDVDTKKKTIQICSLHDCVYAVKRDDGSFSRCGWLFAAYVNENHPVVERILKRALDLKLVSDFSGYQKGPQHVYAQLFAVWHVLQRQGIKYSDIATTSDPPDEVAAQHVRFLDESLSNTQANCVDGSVLFASIFRKIGLKTYLVTTPAHCFVGCVVSEEPRESVFLETTELGTVDLRTPLLAKGFNAPLSIADNDLSEASFRRACESGNGAFREARAHFDKNAGYDLVDLDLARAKGIQPLKSLRR